MSINDEAMSEFIADDGHAIGREPFQFTLRQLFWLMGIVCVLGGAYSWVGFEMLPGLACVSSTFFVVIYLAVQRRFGLALVLAITLFLLAGLLLPSLGPHRESARHMQCRNNLKNLALALQQYEMATGKLPPPYIADANGKPMHSWRVLLLPYLEKQDLHMKYNFNEPWDGPNNSKLHSEIVKLFNCPCCRGKQPATETNYVAVVGPETMWQPGKRNTLAAVSKADGTANTIMLVEVHGSGIHWMEPRDLDFSKLPLAINSKTGVGISSLHHDAQIRGDGANVVFADSHTQWLDNDTLPTIINAILTANGGEKIPDDWEY